MLFAGVEGGGTSTTVALSCDGQLLGTKTGGASNPFLLGENAVVIISSMIRDLVQTLVPENLWTTKSPPLRAVVMTMSGFGRREDAAALEAAVLSSGLAQECVVAGDGAGPLECLHAWLSLHRNRNRDRNRNRERDSF
jgi:N-acetylglucosamine kinase-like BadF-type ATPase